MITDDNAESSSLRLDLYHQHYRENKQPRGNELKYEELVLQHCEM